MILSAEQIEEIKELIFSDEKLAVEKLVEYTKCDAYDAKCLVEEYDGVESFEKLLDKHWIESREHSTVIYQTEKLSVKEKMSLVKIFLPVIIIIIIAIAVISF